MTFGSNFCNNSRPNDVILISILAIFFSSFGYSILKRIRRKKWLLEVQKYETAHSPISQFQSDLRKLQRKYHFFTQRDSDFQNEVSDVDKIEVVESMNLLVRNYLIRELQVKALAGFDSQMMADFKKYHSDLFKTGQLALRQWLKEINNAQAAVKTLKAQDLRQLLRQSRDLVENITAEIEKVKTAKGRS